jgi:NADPH:quinone reductase-like Zn-dependent oxidoreductase
MKAIDVQEFGGPEVLVMRDVEDPVPSDRQILIEVQAAGINYADTHSVGNSYLSPAKLPLIPGAEVVGTTPDGRRVVALLPGGGGYAQTAVAFEPLVFDVQEGIETGVVLEMTGGTVTDQSLKALAPLGRLAYYGMASRTQPNPLDAATMLANNWGMIGFWLAHLRPARTHGVRPVRADGAGGNLGAADDRRWHLPAQGG